MLAGAVASSFLDGVEDAGVRVSLASRGDLEGELARLWDEARSSWTGVDVSAIVFARHLGQRVDRDPDALERLHVRDLYLACACAKGEPHGLDRFDAEYMSPVDAVLFRLGLCESDVDETKQILRSRFFLGEGGSPPRIHAYSGRGALGGWVRSSATRAALRVLRRPKAEAHIEAEAIAALPSLEADSELSFLRREHSADFVGAFREAFAVLSARDRTLLRQSFKYGLSIDKIGTLHRVHRATAARWLADARDDLRSQMHASLMKRLGVGRATAYSIARLVEGEVSLPELLQTGEHSTRRRP